MEPNWDAELFYFGMLMIMLLVLWGKYVNFFLEDSSILDLLSGE